MYHVYFCMSKKRILYRCIDASLKKANSSLLDIELSNIELDNIEIVEE